MSSGESDSYYESKRLNCNHLHTTDHADNPKRFYCPDCRTEFADYGQGYHAIGNIFGNKSKKLQGLTAGEVPYLHETKGYHSTGALFKDIHAIVAKSLEGRIMFYDDDEAESGFWQPNFRQIERMLREEYALAEKSKGVES